MTGAEQIIPQVVSSRFAQRAKADGIITDVVPNETVSVLYNNGKEEVFDILPRRSRKILFVITKFLIGISYRRI